MRLEAKERLTRNGVAQFVEKLEPGRVIARRREDSTVPVASLERWRSMTDSTFGALCHPSMVVLQGPS